VRWCGTVPDLAEQLVFENSSTLKLLVLGAPVCAEDSANESNTTTFMRLKMKRAFQLWLIAYHDHCRNHNARREMPDIRPSKKARWGSTD
jgi:hypothetical protein